MREIRKSAKGRGWWDLIEDGEVVGRKRKAEADAWLAEAEAEAEVEYVMKHRGATTGAVTGRMLMFRPASVIKGPPGELEHLSPLSYEVRGEGVKGRGRR